MTSFLNNNHIILDNNVIIQEDLENIAKSNLPWENLKNKTVLVTGGNGFLASYIIKSILTVSRIYKLNTKIVSILRDTKSKKDRLSDFKNDKNLRFFKHDLTNPLPKSFPKADMIIHAASKASPKYYNNDNAIDIIRSNCFATMQLLENSINKVEKFLFFSSAEVYGVLENSKRIIDEYGFGYLNPLNNRSFYAESKRMGESLCKAYTSKYNLNTSIVRPFHTYGPGIELNDGRVFADFINSIVKKKNIVINSDGNTSRPFCYIADATIAFLKVLLLGKKAEAYNIANPKAEIKIKDLALLLSHLVSTHEVKIKTSIKKNNLSNPIKRQRVCIDKIKKLGWQPSTNLALGFTRTIESYLPRSTFCDLSKKFN